MMRAFGHARRTEDDYRDDDDGDDDYRDDDDHNDHNAMMRQ